MTSEEKKAVTEQVVRAQNELAKLQNLLQDDERDVLDLAPSADFDCLAVTQVRVQAAWKNPVCSNLYRCQNSTLPAADRWFCKYNPAVSA